MEKARQFQHGIWKNVKRKKEFILEVQRDQKKVHFAALMNICHFWRQRSWNPNYRSLKAESSFGRTKERRLWILCSFHWTAFVCVPDDCCKNNGQAADAASAYTQVKLEDGPRLLKIPKTEGPDVWIRLPRHKWPKSWSNIEDLVALLERNLCDHPLSGWLWERQLEEAPLELECTELGMACSFIEKKG